jgi:hypothetical protein
LIKLKARVAILAFGRSVTKNVTEFLQASVPVVDGITL